MYESLGMQKSRIPEYSLNTELLILSLAPGKSHKRCGRIAREKTSVGWAY